MRCPRVHQVQAAESSLPPPGLGVFPDLLREGGEVRGFALQLRGLLGYSLGTGREDDGHPSPSVIYFYF